MLAFLLQLGKYPVRFVCYWSWYTNAAEQNCREYCSTWWQHRHKSINSRYGTGASDKNVFSHIQRQLFVVYNVLTGSENKKVINIDVD